MHLIPGTCCPAAGYLLKSIDSRRVLFTPSTARVGLGSKMEGQADDGAVAAGCECRCEAAVIGNAGLHPRRADVAVVTWRSDPDIHRLPDAETDEPDETDPRHLRLVFTRLFEAAIAERHQDEREGGQLADEEDPSLVGEAPLHRVAQAEAEEGAHHTAQDMLRRLDLPL